MGNSEEIVMLGETARRALEMYPGALDAQYCDSISREVVDEAMKLACDQGWLGAAAHANIGGLELGASAAAALATEAGRALFPGPLMSSVILIPALACRAPALLPLAEAAIANRAHVSIAVPMNAPRGAPATFLADHTATATDVLAVERLRTGIAFTWVQARGLDGCAPFDPTCPVAKLSRAIIEADPCAHVALSQPEADEVLGLTHIWIASELVGVAQRAGELSIAHASERRQFGQLIGANQGIKHRIVDDYVLRETASAIIGFAARAWDDRAHDRLVLAHAARAAAADAAISATAHCIQVHGGLGFSWEHPAHLYYKRARRLIALLGSTESSLAAVADCICTPAA